MSELKYCKQNINNIEYFTNKFTISDMCLVLFENGFRIFANQKRARIFKNGKTVFE
jgi:hypothetical protein